MISQTQNQQEYIDSIILNHSTKVIEIDKWDQNIQRLIKAKIHVTITQNNYIIYSFDGVILRQEQIKDISRIPDIMTNMEQIQYLQWQGKYGMDKRKQDKWTATWDGQALIKVGGYYKDGFKVGLWTEPYKNYWSKAQVYISGEYFHEQKCGKWKYIYYNKNIGGGSYNEQSQKNGKWIELSDSFSDDSRVIYNGEYKNGKKVGRWDICYTKYSSYPFSQIGGGSYDERGDGIKLGKWVEVSDGFYKYSQVTENGEYKNGNKIGRWDISLIWGQNKNMQKKNQIKRLLQTFVSGGGLYDERGDGIKLGNWVEISQGFFEYSQVTYNGEYKNGKKIGKWDIWYKENQQNVKIGGGQYDEGGIKLGNWMEVPDGFKWDSQVTYNGEYINGKKVGRWDIWYKENKQNAKIGGGSYGEGSNEIKVGNWVMVWDGFYSKFQVTYNGEFKNGQKAGRWDIFWNYNGDNTQIGGGSYDDQGDGIKLGKWVELWDKFDYYTQVTYIGEYKNGKKIGRWDICYKENYQNVKMQIYYIKFFLLEVVDHMMMKVLSRVIGWKCRMDLEGILKQLIMENMKMVKKLVDGIFGIRIGEREKMSVYPNLFSGGGTYDEGGDGIQLGSWIEVSDGFGYYCQVTYNGEYKNGKKVGKWVEMDVRRNFKRGEVKYDN